MNYLAHSYLSFNHPEVLVGNMVSDFVKGKKQYDFDVRIQHGIRLHRQIDCFTDEHAATKAARELLKPAVGLYSGAFVDVVYDHFLANDPNELTEEKLFDHAAATYAVLQEHFAVLPSQLQVMLPFMKKQNWLYNYRHTWGTERSFEGVVRRATYLKDSSAVFELFIRHYNLLNQYYADFFPDVKNFAIYQFNEITRA